VLYASYILYSSHPANHVLFVIVRMFVRTKECSNFAAFMHFPRRCEGGLRRGMQRKVEGGGLYCMEMYICRDLGCSGMDVLRTAIWITFVAMVGFSLSGLCRAHLIYNARYGYCFCACWNRKEFERVSK
jgi:hypothetical protein